MTDQDQTLTLARRSAAEAGATNVEFRTEPVPATRVELPSAEES